MSEDLNKTIRELSEIYDNESSDSYVSFYYSKDSDSKFIQRRTNDCRKILKGDVLKNFDETINIILDSMKKTSDKNIAVFASKKNNFLKQISVPIKLENSLVVDSSPYLRPLARIQDEWETFTILLLSSNSAKIYSVELGRIDSSKTLSADIMNKHKKGGWSQARFNRLRKGAIHAFLKEVIEELQERAEGKIILAGPGTTKNQLIDILPQDLKEKITDIIDIDIKDENKLLKESLHLISEKEKRQSQEAVKHLKNEILKEGLAVYGIDDTLRAVKNGQVELLIIQKDKKIPGWICENCQLVKKGNEEKCPYCGGNTSRVDVLEEILEFAERTDAEIEFTESDELEDLGNIGAILRYK